MAKFNFGGNNVVRGTRIADLEAGEVFSFTGSTAGNNGICLRVKDSKAGKARFVNLESGKLLTASEGDTGTPVDAPAL